MRRVTIARIAVSRWLSRRLLGRSELLCAHLEWRQHWSRHLLNALFLDRGHCDRSAVWEARQGREPDVVDEWRAEGWL